MKKTFFMLAAALLVFGASHVSFATAESDEDAVAVEEAADVEVMDESGEDETGDALEAEGEIDEDGDIILPEEDGAAADTDAEDSEEDAEE
jgi:hypothetical protein